MLKKFCALSLILVLLAVTGCARKAEILSKPAGARVLVDGKEVCVTPCSYDYKTGSSGQTRRVVLHKDGYDPVVYEMAADEVDREARAKLWTAGMFIPGGSILWVGTLFTNKLKESYRFVLREEAPVVAVNDRNVED